MQLHQAIMPCTHLAESVGFYTELGLTQIVAREHVAELEIASIAFDSAPEDQRSLWREARQRDPAGNELCLFHAGENRLNPPRRIRLST
jgi:hypothetical protein